MKHCDLVSGLGRLKHAAAELREHWLDAKTHWTDQVSRDFEKNHLQHCPRRSPWQWPPCSSWPKCWSRPKKNWKTL